MMGMSIAVYILRSVVSIVLLTASIASFIPQIRKIRDRGDAENISLAYILINLIVATHNFTMPLLFNVDAIVHGHPGLDWIDFVHFLVVWLGHVVLFAHVAAFSTQQTSNKVAAIATYLFYCCFTLLPAILLPPNDLETPPALVTFTIMYLILFALCFNIPTMILGVSALWFQIRKMPPGTAIGALSVRGLRAQAVVFAVVGVSMTYRMTTRGGRPLWMGFWTWYCLRGYQVVNNLVFAFVQGFLAYVAARRKVESAEGEREPLLPASS